MHLQIFIWKIRKLMQIVVTVSTWNANKVVGHPPNFACKFISCVAILFHTYAVVKLVVFSCPTL